jgi:hypothetical protein
MARESKSDMSIVLRYLRETLGWSQVRLEKTAGLTAGAEPSRGVEGMGESGRARRGAGGW